LAVYSVIK